MPRVPFRQKKRKSCAYQLVSSPYFPPAACPSGLSNLQAFQGPSGVENSEYDDLPYNSLWGAVVHAVRAKPILIQEKVAYDPWKVLVATMLLNVTTGRQAIPVFWALMEKWSSPARMAEAPKSELVEMLRPLGLFETRAERLIKFSKQYIESPPSFDRLWKSRVTGYPPTPVSHFVGCGRYALDSFRIFCCPGDEWKSVMPLDKELIKYLKWKWAIESHCKWEPIRGVIGPSDEAHLWSFAPFSQYGTPLNHLTSHATST